MDNDQIRVITWPISHLLKFHNVSVLEAYKCLYSDYLLIIFVLITESHNFFLV